MNTLRHSGARLTGAALSGLSLLLVLTSPAFADDATDSEYGSIMRYRGEELYYGLELVGAQMASGAMVVGDLVEHGEGQALEIFGIALTDGLAAMIYPMRDEGTTWVDPTTGFPLRSTKDLAERGEVRRYDVEFDTEHYRGLVERLRDDTIRHYVRLLPGNTYDAFSWLYAVREQPLNDGTTYVYYIYDGWKLSRATITVIETDDVLVGDEYIRCKRLVLYRDVLRSARALPMIQESASLPPVMWVRETSAGEQVGELWISDDDRRLPVQIVFHNDLISATARLVAYEAPTDGYGTR